MPLQRNEQGHVTWAPTKAEDLVAFTRTLASSESGALPLTYDLKTKLDQALKTLAPRGGVDAMADANRRLYDNLKGVLGETPGLVDIIVPVHNSIHITRRCLEHVIARTQWPYHVYIVDDASDAFTHQILADFAARHAARVTLITNQRNKGFAASVNRGIRAGNGEYVCLLNSDVFVTDLWLSKMILALKADPRHQIVCPVTNNTAIVDVPMSPGASYLQMNTVFEQFAQRRYPELMPTGLCFLFPRALLGRVGHFDESYQNFGEESDLWWKTIRYTEGHDYKRFKAVLADDTYVFHERGASYSQLGNDTHMYYRKLASSRFNKLWPEWVNWKNTYDVNKTVGGLREKIPATLLRGSKDRYRICWVVHDAKMCGGMKYISDIVNELIEQGVNAKVAVIKRKEDGPEECIGELTCAPIFFKSREEFLKDFPARVFPGGILVAATIELSPLVKLVSELSEGRIRGLLHAQSYEPELVEDLRDKETARQLFKTLPQLVSNAEWLSKRVEEDARVKPFATIHPGVDRYLFYRRDRSHGDDRPTVALIMNPSYACKGFTRGLELVVELETRAAQRQLDLRVLVYGVESLPIVNRAVCLGDLAQGRVAAVLGTEVDAFVDPSLLHSYGMPALEAAACGAKVFSWDNKGIREYGTGVQATVFEDRAPAGMMAEAILDYLQSTEAQAHHAAEYPQISAFIEKYHDREKSVRTLIRCIERQFNLNFVSRRINVVVPHLRKHGGPTTMLSIANELQASGHRVRITTVYSDVNSEVVGMTNLPINVNPQQLPPCDLVITNSDNPLVESLAKLPKVKKILLKLSHNPRFKREEEKGLQQKWDAIVTSTEWLRQVCERPSDGWAYSAAQAHRIGWWNYAFGLFQCHPSTRAYGIGQADAPITLATLIHAHPSKGSREAIDAMGELALKYGAGVRFVGIGEVPPQAFRSNLPNFEYRYAPSREAMAAVLREVDIWISASQSEGLGRMSLEAMSAGAAVIATDTGAEYAKHEENCLLVPQGEAVTAGIVSAAQRLIDDLEFSNTLRIRAFDTAAACADPAPCMEALQKVIQSVFGN